MEFRTIAITSIERSPNNPRKYFDPEKLRELAVSIEEHGIQQPLLVRPTDDDTFELVAGERRLRAAEIAELTHVPCVVRDMTDAQADEVRVVENVQRADLSPLEEADGYRRLHERHGQSVEEIAAKVGKSKAAIYARLKLCDLVEEGRAALEAGKLTASTALLVARLPREAQAKAVEELTEDGEAWPFREAAAYVQREFMLRLALAPFDVQDAALPGGACGACPKRTGAQRDLFADIEDADLCTDPACFRAKVDAAWTKKAAAARKKGLRVIEGDEAAKLFPYGNRPRGEEFVNLDDGQWIAGEQRTYRELLGGKKAKVVAIARTPKGEIVELGDGDAAERAADALRDAEDGAAASAADPATREEAKKRLEEQAERERVREIRRRASEAAVPLLVEAAEEMRSMKGLLRALIDREIDMAGAPDEALTKRRGVEVGDDPSAAWTKAIDKMTEAELRGFLVEFIVSDGNVSYSGEYVPAFAGLCKAFGVELGPLEASAKKKIAAEAKKAAKAS